MLEFIVNLHPSVLITNFFSYKDCMNMKLKKEK